jgi:outer membrane cobalamin receptor
MNSTSNERLLRRPRIVGNLILQHSTQVKTIGVGLTWLHDTIDLDGSTFSRIKGEDYTVVRLYGDRQINESIKFFGRIENLLGEEYDEADGYPALGCQAYAGLRFIF